MWAQAAGGQDFSLFVGYKLPNQIDNVTEILPLFGARYGFESSFGNLEFALENSNAEGVGWTSFGVSLRAEGSVAHGISSLIYAGPSLHYFQPAGESSRKFDYGVHFGVAGLMLVSDTLWLRSDLKFTGGPGTALDLLIGLMFRAPGSGS